MGVQRCRVALRGNAEQEDAKTEIRRHDTSVSEIDFLEPIINDLQTMS
jgi:hypothetical protein